MRLVIVRHGESEWNAAGRVQGQADPGLSDAGRDEVRRLRGLIDGLAPDLATSSDLVRARDTLALLSDLPATTDPRWRESAMGDWTGRPVDELYADPQGRFAAWRAGRADPPGGESWDAMCDRVAAAAADLRAGGGRCALVVTHGGPVRAACAVLAGLGPERLRPVANATLTIIDLEPVARLVAFGVRPPGGGAPRPTPDVHA